MLITTNTQNDIKQLLDIGDRVGSLCKPFSFIFLIYSITESSSLCSNVTHVDFWFYICTFPTCAFPSQSHGIKILKIENV